MLQLTCPISHFACYFPWILPKRLSTMMLQMTDVIWFFQCIFHAIHKKQLSRMMLPITHVIYFSDDIFHKSHKKRLGTKMLQITRVILFFSGICNEIHQNGSVPWCYKSQISSTFFMIVPTKFIKTAQYHDATNNTCHLNFWWVFPWK